MCSLIFTGRVRMAQSCSILLKTGDHCHTVASSEHKPKMKEV